jgi:hypothetical protein
MFTRVIALSLLLAAMTCLVNTVDAWPVIKPLVNTAQIEAVSRGRFAALQARDDSAFTKYYAPSFEMTTAWGTVVDLAFLERWIITAPPGFTLRPYNYRVTVSADAKMAFTTFQVDEMYPGSSGAGPTNITSQYTEIYIHHRLGWVLVEAHFSYLSKAFG